MNQYITFLVAHWEYSLLFVAAFVWVILSEANSKKANLWGVQPQQAIELINQQSALIFDLRDVGSYKEGHIVGSKRVDFKPASDDPKALLKISPQTPCLLICATGQASLKAATVLRGKGYVHAHALIGGIPTWQKENLPLVKGA